MSQHTSTALRRTNHSQDTELASHTNTHSALVENYQAAVHTRVLGGALQRGNGLLVVSCCLDQSRAVVRPEAGQQWA